MLFYADGSIDYPIKEGSVKGTTSPSGTISASIPWVEIKKEIIGARCTNLTGDIFLVVGAYDGNPYFHLQTYGGISLPNTYVEINFFYI